MGVVSLAKKTSSGGDLIGRCGRASSLVLCLALGAGPALTQTAYPAKPIKIIVPYAPGGLTDVVARLYAEQLRQIFARGVVVENKPGASGMIAIEEMARARPDGYTIMIGNISTNGLTPVLLAKKMSIDYQRDVQVISRLADVPVFFLTTTTDFPPRHFPNSWSMQKNIRARCVMPALGLAATSKSTRKYSPGEPGSNWCIFRSRVAAPKSSAILPTAMSMFRGSTSRIPSP